MAINLIATGHQYSTWICSEYKSDDYLKNLIIITEQKKMKALKMKDKLLF